MPTNSTAVTMKLAMQASSNKLKNTIEHLFLRRLEMKKSNIALVAAVAISAVGLFSSVNAADSSTTVDAGGKKGECQTGHCGKGGPGKGGMFKAFGFTDDQLEKMNTLKLDYEKTAAPKKAELMTLSKELRDDMTKPGVSKSQLLQLQGKINEIKAELSNGRISLMADRMALMTDDQKTKIRSFALKRSFGPGGGHHGGPRHFKGKKFHHGGKGAFHRGPGPRPFGGEKPADAPASSVAPATQNEV
jgi:Spy/CpxP family protein refolding chaperone